MPTTPNRAVQDQMISALNADWPTLLQLVSTLGEKECGHWRAWIKAEEEAGRVNTEIPSTIWYSNRSARQTIKLAMVWMKQKQIVETTKKASKEEGLGRLWDWIVKQYECSEVRELSQISARNALTDTSNVLTQTSSATIDRIEQIDEIAGLERELRMELECTVALLLGHEHPGTMPPAHEMFFSTHRRVHHGAHRTGMSNIISLSIFFGAAILSINMFISHVDMGTVGSILFAAGILIAGIIAALIFRWRLKKKLQRSI